MRCAHAESAQNCTAHLTLSTKARARKPGVRRRQATAPCGRGAARVCCSALGRRADRARSEEHTSELQSRFDLVCRLLLEKKKKTQRRHRDDRKRRITKNVALIYQNTRLNKKW